MSAHNSVWAALSAGFATLPTALRESCHLIAHHRNLQLLLVTEFVIGVTLSASERFWQPFFAHRFDLTDTTLFGVIFGGCFAVGLCGNLLSTRLLRWLGGQVAWFGFGSQLLQGVGLILLARQSALWMAIALFWLTYLARSAFASPFRTLFNDPVPGMHRALMLSVLSMILFAGSALGNLGLGQLASLTSIPVMWTVVGVGIAISALTMLSLQSAPLAGTRGEPKA